MGTVFGQAPGVNYTISGWPVNKLRSWLQQSLPALLPDSLQTTDAQLETLTVNTSVSLSPAALADLKKQLGL